MKKRNKKTAAQTHQKELARFHQEYAHQVNGFLTAIGLPNGPDEFSGNMYSLITRRNNLPAVIPAPDSQISKRAFNMAAYLLKIYYKEQMFEAFPGGPSFSFGFFFSTELFFQNFIINAAAKDYPNIDEIRQKIKPYLEHFDQKEKAVIRFIGIMMTAISHSITDDILEMYYFTDQFGKTNVEMANNNRKKARFLNFVLHLKRREEKEILFQNEMRKVIKLSYPFQGSGVSDLLIPAKEMGIDSPFGTLPLPIYIQDHALMRMSQRLGIRYISEIMLEIFFAFNKPRVTPISKGNVLIEFCLSRCKVGYFKVSLAEGALLVQTFLFITNNGTPEGEKLNHLLGMQKADKKYWEIDKLSTFLESDIGENEELKQLFITAGCKSLFDYKTAPKLTEEETSHQHHVSRSEMLTGFLHKTQQTRESDKLE